MSSFRNFTEMSLLSVRPLRYGGSRDHDGVVYMTGQLLKTSRDNFMEAAQRELLAFELKEREFRKQEKQERAKELDIPALKSDFHS